MTKIRVTPHTPKTLLACLSGQLVREWHLTFERSAARHVEICSQLHGEVFISIVHYNGDINVPDHMPPSGFRVGAPRATILCPVRCSNTPPSAPVVRAAKCEVSVAYSKPLWMVGPCHRIIDTRQQAYWFLIGSANWHLMGLCLNISLYQPSDLTRKYL